MNSKEKLDLTDYLSGIVLIGLIVLAPLPFGSVAPWAQSCVLLLSLYMAALWLFQCVRKGRIRICRSPIWFFMLAMLILVVIQLIPMPPGMIAAFSPTTADMYAKTVPNYPASGEMKHLTLDPYQTITTLSRWGALFLILIVIMNTVRTRLQIMAVVLALITVGAFEAVYGLLEQGSGRPGIFWYERKDHLQSVTGTFMERNQFAGIMLMITPLVLGLLVAISPKSGRRTSMRTIFMNLINSRGIFRRILLCILLGTMIVGLYYSRAAMGILCAAVSLAVFLMILSTTTRSRRKTFVTLSVAVLLLAGSAGITMKGMAGNEGGGVDRSWEKRTELWKSGLALSHNFPIVGTGLGAISPVIERYQPGHVSEVHKDNLHNDWLQVLCETGFLGGLALLVGGLFTAYRLFRRTLIQEDRFCRWIAVGALTGTVTMGIYGFFTHDLHSVPAIGIVFVALLGLWHAAVSFAEKPERSYMEVRVPFKVMSYTGAILLLLAMAWPAARAIRTGLADLHFNRYLAATETYDNADDHHFITVKQGCNPAKEIEKALKLDTLNPEFHFHYALNTLSVAERAVEAEAVDAAKAILGEEAEAMDPNNYRTVLEALKESLEPQISNENRAHLLEAETYLKNAASLSPCRSEYHTCLSKVKARSAGIGAERLPCKEAMNTARRAYWLAPNEPQVLFEVGKIFTSESKHFQKKNEREAAFRFALQCFQNAIRIEPDYADRVYGFLEASKGGKELFLKATPRTVAGYERLVDRLWKAGLWQDVLACLDTAIRLMGVNPDPVAHEESLQSASNKRCTVLGILGRWKERNIEIARHSLLVKTTLSDLISRAQRLRDSGRHRESLSLCFDALRLDWKHQEALVEAASLLSLPSLGEKAPPYNSPLDLMFRLVVNSQNIRPELMAEMHDILDASRLEDSQLILQRELIRGASFILAGFAEEGLEVLNTLAQQVERTGESWRQRHLVWFYQGMAYERKEKITQAAEAYRKVMRDVNTHLAALTRLAFLEQNDPSSGSVSAMKGRIDALIPPIPCEVNFGGKVILMGLGLSKEQKPDNPDEYHWYMKYYWKFMGPMPAETVPNIRFLNSNWQTVFKDNHIPRKEGGSYRVDAPRTGEVVVEKQLLMEDPTGCEYLQIGLLRPTAHNGESRFLTNDEGEEFFTTNMENLLNAVQ